MHGLLNMEKKTLIIGLAGMMRTGKSSIACLIQDEYGGRIDSFASALRDELAHALFPKERGYMARFRYNLEEDQDKALFRPLLQTWGRVRRKQDPAYWVDKLHTKWVLAGNLADAGLLVIDDVRHENEVEWILNNGGFIIRLTADVPTLVARGAQPDRLADYSETALLRKTDVESRYPHRVMRIDTGGRSALGSFRAMKPILDELIDEVEVEEE